MLNWKTQRIEDDASDVVLHLDTDDVNPEDVGEHTAPRIAAALNAEFYPHGSTVPSHRPGDAGWQKPVSPPNPESRPTGLPLKAYAGCACCDRLLREAWETFKREPTTEHADAITALFGQRLEGTD